MPYTIGMNGTASGVAQRASIIVQEIAGSKSKNDKNFGYITYK